MSDYLTGFDPTARTIRSALATSIVLMTVSISPVYGEQLGGGGAIGAYQTTSCISDVDRELVAQLIDDYEREFGPRSREGLRGTPQPITFFPLAGRLWRDLFVFNYVDVDPSGGILDWDCSEYTYNGHNGSDTVIRSFGEQIIGVPVYAAHDGTVVATQDGEDDMNTEWAGQPANFVIVDHGSGREGWYFHLKKNSVAVSVGQNVSAGEQIGLCASSGVSTGPHLHFEIRDDGVAYEPFAGPCRAGDSGWVDQPPLDRSSYLHDFGVTHLNIAAFGPWPNEWPRTGQIALSDSVVRIWWYGTVLPAGSHWRVQFRKPDGTIVFAGGNQVFGNPFWRWYNWWWTYNVVQMHTITGTWHVLLSVNDELMIEAPIEVVTTRLPDFNRPPEPITVEFDPPEPLENQVLSCLVNTSMTLDDLDYDIVRYQYVWTVDDVEVRSVTTAAHSDVLSRNLVTIDSQIACSVTPNDGKDDGQGDSVAATVARAIVPAASDWGLLVMTLLILTAGSCAIGVQRKA